ncbi:MAG: hypothetical protein IT453_20925, partial [Planctomycetes bacterium]|nr:hypothetical protein [Planctomycetota bacterium]
MLSIRRRGHAARVVHDATHAPQLVRHLERCLRTARAISPSDDLARDAVQEALILFWSSEIEPSDVPGWLVRTTVHRALHHSRASSRRARREEFAAAERSELALDDEPTRVLESRELAGQIAHAVARLPDEFRVAFELRELG